jgi:Asp-tRNA(Asn)/Glu-tRNA(Gln) amidotransferase A subunit family amidase
MLRAAGSIVMGKTVTTEYATRTRTPGKTRNPHNAEHTPGGSSSGSAAAVAARMVPRGGRQPDGRLGDPAGVVLRRVRALKPTHGLIPRTGMFQLSRTLDHVGSSHARWRTRAAGLEQVAGHDEGDPDSRPRPRVPYRAIAAEEPPLEPVFAFVKTPRWKEVARDAQEAFGELVETLGHRVEEVELFEGRRSSGAARSPTPRSPSTWPASGRRGAIAVSRRCRARASSVDATCSRATTCRRAPTVPSLVAGYAELFEQRYDAILTPAAPGTAPKGLESTGDPMFNTVWTLCGMPAVTLPLMRRRNGLRRSAWQLVGPRRRRRAAAPHARWLVERLTAA